MCLHRNWGPLTVQVSRALHESFDVSVVQPDARAATAANNTTELNIWFYGGSAVKE